MKIKPILVALCAISTLAFGQSPSPSPTATPSPTPIAVPTPGIIQVIRQPGPFQLPQSMVQPWLGYLLASATSQGITINAAPSGLALDGIRVMGLSGTGSVTVWVSFRPVSSPSPSPSPSPAPSPQ